MSIKVAIEVVDVQVKTGTNSRGPWQIREQEAWAHLKNRDGTDQRHPTRIVLNLDEQQQPYPIGEYTIAGTSFYAGKYSSLMFSPRLVPLRPAVAKVA